VNRASLPRPAVTRILILIPFPPGQGSGITCRASRTIQPAFSANG
jgi:hypothetical protein